jgi:hypothetical protein
MEKYFLLKCNIASGLTSTTRTLDSFNLQSGNGTQLLSTYHTLKRSIFCMSENGFDKAAAIKTINNAVAMSINTP